MYPAPRHSTVLILWMLWISFEYFILLQYSYFQLYDSSELYMHLAALETVGQGWTPLIRGGTDLALTGSASWVSQVLFGILPIRLVYPILITTALAGSTWCMYCLIRRKMGANATLPATLAAMAYGACATSIFLVNINMALQPMALLTLSRYLDAKRSIARLLAAAAISVVTVGAPFPSDVVQYFSPALVVWFAVVERRTARADWLVILLFCAVPAMRINEFLSLSAHLSETAFYYTREQNRVDLSTILNEFIKANRLPYVEFLIIHIGAVFGIFFINRSNYKLIIFIITSVVSVIFSRNFISSYDGPISALIYSFVYQKILWYVILPELTVAMAFGLLWSLGRLPPMGRRAVAAGIIGAMILSTGYRKYQNLTLDWLSNGNYVRNFESPVLRALASQVAREPWPYRVEPIFLCPNHLNAYGLETESGDMPAGSKRHFEFWSAAMEPWIALEGGALAVWPEQADLLKRDGGWPEFRGERANLVTSGTRTAASYSIRPMDQLYRMNLLSLANIRYFVSREPLSGPGLVELQRAPKPWGELSTREKIVISLTENFNGRTWLYVYRNDHALPRFFTVRDVRAFDTDRATVEAMAEASIETLGKTLFVNRAALPPGLAADSTFEQGNVTLISYSADRIELEVAGNGPRVLIASNTFSRYWKASVDGVPAALFPADHTFWGIALDKGRHRVVFTYLPSYLPWAKLPPSSD